MNAPCATVDEAAVGKFASGIPESRQRAQGVGPSYCRCQTAITIRVNDRSSAPSRRVGQRL